MFAWSRSAREVCRVPDKPVVYAVATTGLWGEAIRQRKPIITNDYSAPNPYKQGVPEGHVELRRHMNVPVFDGPRIVAVAGVANKAEDYDESDVRQLTLLMSGMWRLIQRKRAEDELRESEERYRLLFERSPDIVFVLKDHRFTAVNTAVKMLFGYDPGEIIGLTPWDISPERQPDGALSEEKAVGWLTRALSEGTQTFEWQHQRKDGSSVDCEVSLTAYNVHGETHVQAPVRDITERKRAEEHRRALERRLEAQQRQFYRETLLSVTDGKLNICETPPTSRGSYLMPN